MNKIDSIIYDNNNNEITKDIVMFYKVIKKTSSLIVTLTDQLEYNNPVAYNLLNCKKLMQDFKLKIDNFNFLYECNKAAATNYYILLCELMTTVEHTILDELNKIDPIDDITYKDDRHLQALRKFVGQKIIVSN